MALTPSEITVIRQMLKYYSGDIPNLPEDSAKIQALIEADEEGKRTLLKKYMQTVVLPNDQVQLVNLQNAVTTTTNRIASLNEYLK